MSLSQVITLEPAALVTNISRVSEDKIPTITLSYKSSDCVSELSKGKEINRKGGGRKEEGRRGVGRREGKENRRERRSRELRKQGRQDITSVALPPSP